MYSFSLSLTLCLSHRGAANISLVFLERTRCVPGWGELGLVDYCLVKVVIVCFIQERTYEGRVLAWVVCTGYNRIYEVRLLP